MKSICEHEREEFLLVSAREDVDGRLAHCTRIATAEEEVEEEEEAVFIRDAITNEDRRKRGCRNS